MRRARILALSIVAAAAGAVLTGALGTAQADTPCTATWTGADGSWTDAASWSTAATPGSADVVCLPATALPYTVQISDSQSVAALRVYAGATLAVRPASSVDATLTVAGASANDGTIVLDETGRSSSARISVTAGALDNNGTLRTQLGSTDCCPGQRSFTGNLNNHGTFDVQLATTFTGTLVNDGTISVGESRVLSLVGAASQLTQAGGTIANAGALIVDTGTFGFSGGSLTGNPPVVPNGTVSMIGSGARSGEVAGHGNVTLLGNVPTNVTVRLRSGSSEASTLTIPSSATNAGSIVLDEDGRSASAALAITSGTLTNTGLVRTQLGTTDCCPNGRSIVGNVTNQGTLDVQLSTTFTGTLLNSGALTVGEGSVLTLSGPSSVLSQSGGTQNVAGGVTVAGGTFSFAAGSLTGNPPVVTDGTIAMVGAAARSGEVRGHGNLTLTGNVPVGVTVRLRTGYAENSVLTLPADATNSGTIAMDAEARYGTVKLVVASGKQLTNNGRLESSYGPADCCADSRTIQGSIVNQGTFAVDTNTALEGALINSGQTAIAATKTLTVQGANAAISQTSGTLSILGGLTQTSGTFDYTGGQVTGNPVGLVGNRLHFGALTGSHSGSFFISGSGPTIGGAIPSGVEVHVRPGYGEATTLTADGSFTNAGTLILEHGGRYSQPTITVPGTLTNTGTLRSSMGDADCCTNARTLNGNLLNSGTLDIAQTLTLGSPAGHYTTTGAITIAAGQQLNATAGGQVLELAGGTLTVNGSLALTGGIHLHSWHD